MFLCFFCLFLRSVSESRTLVNDLDLMKGLCHYMASLGLSLWSWNSSTAIGLLQLGFGLSAAMKIEKRNHMIKVWKEFQKQ